jgi:hypothetical protein
LVKVNKNTYGVLTAQVVAIATGGGNPSTAKKTEIETELESKSSLEEIDVFVEDATLTTVTVTSGNKMLSGYSFTTIEPYINLGWKLFFTEKGAEILDKYNSDSLENTITLINSLFSTSFTEDNDGVEIQSLLEGLKNLGYRDFGDEIQESDAFSYIQANIDGIDYLTISSPSFPITLSADEITTETGSTFNITEIV